MSAALSIPAPSQPAPAPSQPAPAPSQPAPAAPPAAKGPPKFLPVVLFLFLPLFFSLCFAPLIASTANPVVSNLNIAVVSFDQPGTPIDALFTSFFTTASQQGSKSVPSIDMLSPSTTSPAALHTSVAGIDAWATIFLTNGSWNNLLTALTNPQATASSYQPASAITFEYNEGRSQVYPYVTGPANALLAQFVRVFSAILNQQIAQGVLPGVNLTAIALYNPSLLTTPVAFATEVVCPSSWLPLSFTALTLGNILMAVFGLAITNVVLGPLTPFLVKGRSPTSGTCMRILALLAFSGLIPLAFSSIITGLGSPVSGVLSVAIFFRVWAILWLAILGYCFYFCFWVLLAGTPAVLPLFLLPLICFNSTGGWLTDLAPIGYTFFRYAPFYQTSVLMRNVLFNAFPGRQGIHLGVLFAWLVLFLVPFVIVSIDRLRKMQNAMKAAALKAAEDASKAKAAAAPATATAAASLAAPSQRTLPATTAAVPVPADSLLAAKGYTVTPPSVSSPTSAGNSDSNSPASSSQLVSSPQSEVEMVAASPAAVAVEVAASQQAPKH